MGARNILLLGIRTGWVSDQAYLHWWSVGISIVLSVSLLFFWTNLNIAIFK
jgi:hypothetical protein